MARSSETGEIDRVARATAAWKRRSRGLRQGAAGAGGGVLASGAGGRTAGGLGGVFRVAALRRGGRGVFMVYPFGGFRGQACIALIVWRRRWWARAKKAAPIAATISNWGHTTGSPAPRNSTDWARLT